MITWNWNEMRRIQRLENTQLWLAYDKRRAVNDLKLAVASLAIFLMAIGLLMTEELTLLGTALSSMVSLVAGLMVTVACIRIWEIGGWRYLLLQDCINEMNRPLLLTEEMLSGDSGAHNVYPFISRRAS